MSDIRNEAPFDRDEDLNWDWRRYMENKEMLAQAKDCEMAKKFWDELTITTSDYYLYD